ncbi:MAG TPA: hypothetical protein PLF84_20595 [Bryobacteraceae bacterium]|nr:hypothetical protein [Bryobacteraceae bacterium]
MLGLDDRSTSLLLRGAFFVLAAEEAGGVHGGLGSGVEGVADVGGDEDFGVGEEGFVGG